MIWEGMNEYCPVGIIRQQLGRWHRRQNKFGKLWQQTEVTVRWARAYFIWFGFIVPKKILLRKELRNAIAPWSWNDLITYPTLYWPTTECYGLAEITKRKFQKLPKSFPHLTDSILIIVKPLLNSTLLFNC